jgi:hypothetical protein
MQEPTLRDKICDEFEKLPPSRIEHVSRSDLFESPRIHSTRQIDFQAYHGRFVAEQATTSHDVSVDLAKRNLPQVPVDMKEWRDLIAASTRFTQCMSDLFFPALSDSKTFPVIFELFQRNMYAPLEMIPSLVADDLALIPDRELRPLLLQREQRQELNRREILRLLPELKAEIRKGLSELSLQLNVPHLEIPWQEVDRRLEELHVEIFDPLKSKSFTDIAFYSVFSHTIFVSTALSCKEYRPILRHEMLHAASGLAPIIARADGPAEAATGLLSATKESFFWDRHGLVSFKGHTTNYVWLNEGVTEFLNQTIGKAAGHPECAVQGWGRIADVIGRMSNRVDISPLLNIYFSDAPLHDLQLDSYRAELQRNLKRVYGSRFLEEMERVWLTERSQHALCALYNERYNSPSIGERGRVLFASLKDAFFG